MAFLELWEEIPEAKNKSKEGSEEASNKFKHEVDSVKDKKDLLMQKGPADVNMVNTLPQSFKVKSVEYEEAIYEEDKLTVAQLQLDDVKPADSVVFEKSSIMQTRFVRLLFIRALIEGRPVGRVMVDGGAMANVVPHLSLRSWAKVKMN
uniref:Uncharacterized protein n=1 Tax=Ananas comosus var. bracteatus TaxID=296719 RepID=A0A6V7PSE7_ANACO|nr:unnamed protein product [Ananas comosus var. bracteatus]